MSERSKPTGLAHAVTVHKGMGAAFIALDTVLLCYGCMGQPISKAG